MRRLNAATAYLLNTLPRDMSVAVKIVASRKFKAWVMFLSFMALIVVVNLLVMGATTSSLPTVNMNTEYWGLAAQRLTTASPGELPATLLETTRIYLDYPAVWFTFERLGFEEQARALAMDTTAVFPVINIRYFLESGPIAFLLTIYLLLSRHRAKEMRAVRSARAAKLLSISVPTGSSALGSALAPMACCGGTAVQSVASVIGVIATAPAVILFSTLSVFGVAALLIIGIARVARTINSGCC